MASARCFVGLTTPQALDDWLLGRLKLTGDENAALSELKLTKFSVLIDCPQ